MLNLISYLKKRCRDSKLHILVNYSKFLYLCVKDLLKAILGRIEVRKQNGCKTSKPKIIQMPLTNNCNLRCKTCNVYNHKGSSLSLTDLQKAVKDDFFSEVVSVGINGGEPFTSPQINEYLNTVLLLPKLKSVSIISNGILTSIILDKLEYIYKKCKEKNVTLLFTTSLDGCKNIHDKIRGLDGAFDKTIKTYHEITSNKNKYCDKSGIICTISRYNIYDIKDFIAYVNLHKLENVSYQLAVKHKRLHNEEMSFSVLDDKYTKMLAQELFYELFTTTKENKYYFIFRYLNDGINRSRMSPCNFANRDVTIDGLGNLLYCATSSKIIGHITENNLSEIFFAKENIDYRKGLVDNECDGCIHYTGNNGYLKSNMEAYRELKDKSTWYYNYL